MASRKPTKTALPKQESPEELKKRLQDCQAEIALTLAKHGFTLRAVHILDGDDVRSFVNIVPAVKQE